MNLKNWNPRNWNWKKALAFLPLILVLLSGGKLALYEFSGAAPKLREAVGSEVIIPCLPPSMDPAKGSAVRITEVGYRWNDKVGFFDLFVEYERGATRLSIAEAMDIKVLGNTP